MKIWTFCRLLFRRMVTSSPEEREYVGWRVARELTRILYPDYIFSDHGRLWMTDRAFRDYFVKYNDPREWCTADRKFFIGSLLNLVADVPGDTAECGVFEGGTSYLMCEFFRGTDRLHHGFDSFEGVSEPGSLDGKKWKKGMMTATEETVRRRIGHFPGLRLYGGWIPSRFAEVADRRFCFVHIDVDLHAPTLDSLEFFYPRLSPGAIVVGDDYGFTTTPGATKAFDDFLADKPEKLIHVPTGQGFFIKR